MCFNVGELIKIGLKVHKIAFVVAFSEQKKVPDFILSPVLI